MFEGLIDNIESTIANKIYRVQFTNRRPIQPKIDISKAIAQKQEVNDDLAQAMSSSAPQKAEQAKVVSKTTKGSVSDLASVLGNAKTGAKTNQATAKVKIKRNEPCPCGSGKKYKKCGLIDAPEHRG